jgi:hypothetical protein
VRAEGTLISPAHPSMSEIMTRSVNEQNELPRWGNCGRSRHGKSILNWLPRWDSTWFVVAMAVGLIWYLAHEWPILPGSPKAGDFANQAARDFDASPSGAVELMNIRRAALKLPVALDGIAAIYDKKVAGLVAEDGRFRTDLSAEALSVVLGIAPETVSWKSTPDEIDPDVVLFTAVTGQLSARAKTAALELRAHEQSEGRLVNATDNDWVKTIYRFTLKTMRSPTPDERALLEAISRSARGIPSTPGARINAVGLSFAGPNPSLVEATFAPGYLPLESPPADGKP